MLVSLDLPPPVPGFELSLASHGMSQGVMQTDGMQVVPRTHVQIGDVQIGGQWKNVSSPSFAGVAAVFLKLRHKFGSGQLDAGVAFRIRTGATASTDRRAWEFFGGGRKSFGKLALRVGAEYSPKDFERGKSLYVELGPAFDLDQATKISANIGRRGLDGGPDYTSFNAGISRVVGRKLTLDGRYYGTNRAELGTRFRGHIIISARLSFLDAGGRK